MARIRTIKPDAFKSETLSDVSFFARWLFAGLWTYCDDYGRGRGDARLIKAELFPLDDLVEVSSVEKAVDELVRIGSVCRFEIDGKTYIHCPKWADHQKVSHPVRSRVPDCPRHLPEPSGSSPEDSGDAPEARRRAPEVRRPEGKGREGNREGEGEATGVAPPRRPPAKCRKHLNDPDPPPCGPCASARRTADAWQPPTLSAKSYKCMRHPDQPAGRCPKCIAEAVPRPRSAS